MQKDINQEEVTYEIQARFENVAAALYLVTNHLSDSESLKHKVRSISQIVLEEFVTLSDASTKIIFDRLGHIRSLLKISSVAGLITKQNVTLIDGEIQIIQRAIKDLQESVSNLSVSLGKVLMLDFVGTTYTEDVTRVSDVLQNRTIQVHKNDAYVDEHLSQPRITSSVFPQTQKKVDGIPALNQPQSKQRIAGHTGSPDQVVPTRGQVTQRDVSHPSRGQMMSVDIPKPTKPTKPTSTPQFSVTGMSATPSVATPKSSGLSQQASKEKGISTGLSPRQGNIIREIKSKGQLTIRDLVGKIEGCSEKTIQRELLSLVESGVLRKEGERRWSRYSVN